MKRIYIIITLILFVSLSSRAQNKTRAGGGYSGNTVTYPGLVFEFESEKTFTETASLPLRIDLGVYYHPRYHTGVFADVNYGFRKYFKSGLFLEESIGIGVLGTVLSSEGAFEVDDTGQVNEVLKINKPDFMPSVTLGIGYAFGNDNSRNNLIWLRPKIFWQYPHKTNSTFTPSLQLGFTKTINQ